jgi:hypothetical protein
LAKTRVSDDFLVSQLLLFARRDDSQGQFEHADAGLVD